MILAFNRFMAITSPFINWRHTADTTDGAAIVQNVFEFSGDATDYTLGISHDSGTNDFHEPDHPLQHLRRLRCRWPLEPRL